MPPNYPPRKKQNTFFVDTKSTCFLCLEEIPSDPSPISIIMLDESDDDDAVQLKLSGGTKEAKTEKKEPFCLRAIFKLLQLDTGKVLLKKLSAGPFLLPNLANTDLTVVLCNSCIQITTQLTTLFRELELLQMKLDHAVAIFAEILRNSEEDPNRLERFRNSMLDPFDLLQGSIAELMRKETLKRCSRHLRMFWPKVNLSSAKEVVVSNRVASVIPAPPLALPISPAKVIKRTKTKRSTDFTCNLCSKSCRTFDKLNVHMRSRHQVSATSLTSQKLLSSQLPKRTCNACGRRFKERTSIYRHKKYYCKFRSGGSTSSCAPPATTTPPTTSSTLHELPKWKPRVKVDEQKNKFETKYKCSVCPETFPTFSGLSIHMRKAHQLSAVSSGLYTCNACGIGLKCGTNINRHKMLHCKFRSRTLKISLENVEKEDSFTPATTSINLDELLRSCPRIKVEDKDQVVLFCGLCPSQNNKEKFRLEEQLEKHVFTHHPEYLFSSMRLPDCSEDDFRDLCEKLLENELSQREIEDGDDTTNYTCSDCPNSYSDELSMYTHRFKEHYSIYSSKLLGWQTSFRCQTCARSFASRDSLRRHCIESGCPYRGKILSGTCRPSVYHCKDCGKKVKKKSCILAHMKTCRYRDGDDDDEEPAASHDRHYQASSNVGSSSSSVVYQCQECYVEYSLHSDLREHIAFLHPNPLGERSGRCECGLFVPDLRDHIKRRWCSAHRWSASSKNTVKCEHCGSIMRKASLYRHMKSCPAAAGKSVSPPPPETPRRYPPQGIPMEGEEELMELNQGVFTVGGTTKIEVMVPTPVQLFSEQPFFVGDT